MTRVHSSLARRVRALAVLGALALLAAALLAGAFAWLDRGAARDRGAVVVGSKAFTESIVLGEIMAQWLERRGGLRVVRRHRLGGTHIAFEALRRGEVDVYAEYTGTGLTAILARPAMSDPREVLGAVRREFARRYDLLWLEPFGLDNTYCLAMARRRALALGVRTISDLARHPTLRAGFATEFLARPDGWPGLRRHYGLRFAEEPASMEAGLMYEAAALGRVDVISAYSTDGRIATQDLAVLADDRRFFPPYQAAPLVRRALLAREPRVRALLAELAGTLSDDDARRMNAEVDAGRASPAAVARAFVDARMR